MVSPWARPHSRGRAPPRQPPRPRAAPTCANDARHGRMSTRRAHPDGLRLAHAIEDVVEGRPFILGIPTRGVLLADAVARAARAPLDVLLVRRVLGAGRRTIAAVAEGGAVVRDDGAI